MPAAASIIVHNHPSALQGAWTGGKPRLATACFWAHRTVAMHVSAYELPRTPIPRTWVNSTTKRVHLLHTSGHFAPTKPEYGSTLASAVAIIEAYARRPCHERRSAREGDKAAPLVGGVPRPALRSGASGADAKGGVRKA